MRRSDHPRSSRSAARLAAAALLLAGIVPAFSIAGASAAFGRQAQAGSAPVREVQVLEQERTGVASPVGLAFSPATGAFFVIGAAPAGLPETDVAKLTPFAFSPTSDRSGSARLAAAVQDPINIAFDPRHDRLLILGRASELYEVRMSAGGDLDRQSLNRRDAARLGLKNPQGMAVDPVSGAVFVLDGAQPRIVRIDPASDGSFGAATTSEIDLRPAGLRNARGLAFDPGSRHLHLGSGRSLVELTTAGVVVATRDLSDVMFTKSEGLVFAPSGDQTDAPSQLSLYLADSGKGTAQASTLAPVQTPPPASTEGQIVELSLAPQAAAAAATFTSQLVRTLDMGALSPPSPDPSGITYVPSTDRLLVSDGEVEETVGGVSHFQGANVWELNRNGLTLARTANVSKRAPIMVSMTDEPAGAGFNSANGHYLFSEDGGKRIYDLNPGADGLITAGDTFTFFGVNGFGNTDPEGVTYNPINGRVYVADGVNREVYEYTPAGGLLGHFDTAQYGVDDPEAVEANPQTGTLYVLSNRQSGPIIVETTTSGALLQTIDVSAATGAQKPAGLAYANASNGSGVKRFYWVDRGIDNNNDKNAVDGKLYEMTAPGGGPPPPNNPPAITSNGGGASANVSVPENQTAVTTVTATDPDGNPITYSVSGGNDASRFAIDPSTGVLTFVTAPDFENPTDVGGNNVYNVTVRASDGSLFDEQAIAATVSDVGENPPVITSNGGGGTAAISVAENQTAATDVDATDANGDTVTYSISGGADQARFSIVPTTGILTFVSAPNFEAPTDAGGNNVYDVVVRATDGSLFDTQAIAVTVTDVVEAPEPPVIAGGDTATVSASENQTAVTDVDATDANGDTITYAKAGGADEAKFAIDSSTGVLTFVSAPDFEAPADAGGNNVYDVVVSASDGSLSDTQAIAVTVTDASEGSPLYFSLLDPATVGGVAAENEDIVFFNGSAFSLAFDGSDVGITSLRIDAFSWVDASRVLLSFDVPGAVPGVSGTTDDSDIVLFTATSLGSVTSGTFSMYFDGSDVGLTTTQEDIDAVELLPNGRILISTVNTAGVTGVTSEDEDLLQFVPTQLGPVTSGSFSMYFDGSDVGLTAAGEDVDAAAVAADGRIHLSTFNNFSVTGVSGADEDVFVFAPSTLGTSTTGTFSSSLYFDGSVHGLAANDVFAIDLP